MAKFVHEACVTSVGNNTLIASSIDRFSCVTVKLEGTFFLFKEIFTLPDDGLSSVVI